MVLVVALGTTLTSSVTASTPQDSSNDRHSADTGAAAAASSCAGSTTTTTSSCDGTTYRRTDSSSNEEEEGEGEDDYHDDRTTKTDDWCRLAVQDGRCTTELEFMIEQQCSEACLRYSDELGTMAVVHKNQKEGDDRCVNQEDEALCDDFVHQHECLTNPQYMYEYCRHSCWMCYDFSSEEEDTKRIERVMGVPQRTKPIPSSSLREDETTTMETNRRIQELFLTTLVDTQHYLETVVLRDAHYQSVRRTGCFNHDPYCTWYVAQQQVQLETHDDEDTAILFCDLLVNQIRCGPACQSCAALLFSPDEVHTLQSCTPDPATNLLRDATTTTTITEEEDDEDSADERITLDTMFRRMIGEMPYPSAYAPHVPPYNVTVISRPSLHPEKHYGKAYHELDFVVGGPWILVLDNFLTDEDCDQLIAWGDTIGRQASTFVNDGVDDVDVDNDDNYEDEDDDDDNYEDDDDDNYDDDDDDGDDAYEDQDDNQADGSKIGEDRNYHPDQVGTDEEPSTTETQTDDDDDDDATDDEQWRTSTTAWCSEQSCGTDPIVRDIERKIGYTTSVVDTAYFEHLQLLKYVGGQYYKHHHDESAEYHNEPYDTSGPRIVTFFLYLNDVGESGGGAGGGGGGATRFTDILGDESNIHVEVQPKRGRAVVWPSMRNQDLLDFEERTFHEARSVDHGHVKYGANMWLHLRPFRTSGCDDQALMRITNTFDILQQQYPHLDDDDDEE